MTKPSTFAQVVATMAATLTAHAGVAVDVTHRGADLWTASFEGTAAHPAAAHPAAALVEVLRKVGTDVTVDVCEDLEMTCVYFKA